MAPPGKRGRDEPLWTGDKPNSSAAANVYLRDLRRQTLSRALLQLTPVAIVVVSMLAANDALFHEPRTAMTVITAVVTLGIAGATLVAGVLLALSVLNPRRRLAFAARLLTAQYVGSLSEMQAIPQHFAQGDERFNDDMRTRTEFAANVVRSGVSDGPFARFSPQGWDTFNRSTFSYMRDLVLEADRVSRRGASDDISRSHVERAAASIAIGSPRRSQRVASTLSSAVFGACLSILLGGLVNVVTISGVALIAVGLAAAAASLVLGLCIASE